VTAVNAKGSSDALMVRAYTRKSDGLRQLIETSESALATNVANSHRGKGFVDSVWFLGGVCALAGVIVAIFLALGTALCVSRTRKRRATQIRQLNSTTAAPPTSATAEQYNMTSPQKAAGSNDEKDCSLEVLASPTPTRSPGVGQMHPRGGYMSVPSADPTPPHTGPPVRRAGWRSGGGGRLDEGGFEYQGEKTRFATLQKQRLFAELRSTKTKNQSFVSTSLASPHSAFESSSEKLLSNSESPMHSAVYPGSGSPMIYRKCPPDPDGGGPVSAVSSTTSGCGTETAGSSEDYYPGMKVSGPPREMTTRLNGSHPSSNQVVTYSLSAASSATPDIMNTNHESKV